MGPLYQAVAHGCRAGLYQETCDEIYFKRILRGTTGPHAFYSTKKLGAFGAELGAVACFFDRPWNRLAPGLMREAQAWLLSEAATRLRALSRLDEALEPMRAGLEMAKNQKAWKNAAVGASKLSELELTMGEIAGATRDGRESVELANLSEDAFERMSDRTTLADALHQAGRAEEARELFVKAERMQAENQKEDPLLYSLRGFQFCDLLLAEIERAAWRGWLGWQSAPSADPENVAPLIGQCEAIERRAAQTLKWATEGKLSLLTIALDHLTLGRAALYRGVLGRKFEHEGRNLRGGEMSLPAEATYRLEAAVEGLRRAGTLHNLPWGLISRAWLRVAKGNVAAARADLDEAWTIAERGPMRLHMADILLTRARLFRERAALAAARDLIGRCGYHRRDGELADATAAAAGWPA